MFCHIYTKITLALYFKPVNAGFCATSATSVTKCSKECLKLFKMLKNTKPVLVPFNYASLLRPTQGYRRWKSWKPELCSVQLWAAVDEDCYIKRWPVLQLRRDSHWSPSESWQSVSIRQPWARRFATEERGRMRSMSKKKVTAITDFERWPHLSHIVHLHLSLRVPSGDLLPRVSPSDTVECRPTLHVHAGSRNLKDKRWVFCTYFFTVHDFCTMCACVLLYHCWGSTGPDVLLGPHKRTEPGVLETTLHHTHNHNCPRRSTMDGCSAEKKMEELN